MKQGAPSATAGWVAAMRGIAPLLPREARLCDDPYGARFGGELAVRLRRAASRRPALAPLFSIAVGPVRRTMLWMQLRTRALDEIVLDFARASGRQLLLLGAGYDARAWRFSRELEGCRVFEVDHPATQARKRRLLERMGAPPAPVSFVPFDFEAMPLVELPARLASLGHDPGARTLTLWEGVTPYLTARAVGATLGAVRALSAPGSLLAFTYVDRELLERPRGAEAAIRRLVARVGEPYRFGLAPAEVAGFLSERSFRLVKDESHRALAGRLLPPSFTRDLRAARDESRHVALARIL